VKVGFYLVDTQTLDSMACYACARALVKSIRTVMPRTPVVQLTDDSSPEVVGVDDVKRFKSEPMARMRMRHHGSLTGEWLFVDADVLIQRDVRDVFNAEFDLAVTNRDWPHVKPAAGFTEAMPYNMGVVFSRNPQFWGEAYAQLRELPKPAQRWMGDQEVFGDLIATRRYNVKMLSGTVYNYPPAVRGEETAYTRALEAEAAIVHFKGARRKPIMLSRIGEVVPCA
jgi:hypothetical protein